MFSFDTTPVMFTGLLILFAWCTVWSTVELVAARGRRQRVSLGLHLVMSVVMLVMVPRALWFPFRSALGFPVLVAFFALATGWFVWLALRSARAGEGAHGHLLGHAVMFGAMTWHLAGMAVRMQAMAMAPGAAHEPGHTMASGASMASGAPMAATHAIGALAVAWVGLPFMAALLVMGLRDLTAAVAPARFEVREHSHAPALVGGHAQHSGPDADRPDAHRPDAHRPAGGRAPRAGAAMMAAMNLGMFWMSVGLVTPLLPFLAVLQR